MHGLASEKKTAVEQTTSGNNALTSLVNFPEAKLGKKGKKAPEG